MKQLVLTIAMMWVLQLMAQTYITTGSIEYEVKSNTHAQLEGNDFFENMKDKIPKFATNYYKLSFDNNKSIYKFDRKGDAKGGFSFFGGGVDESVWYNDFNTKTYTNVMTLDGYLLLSGAQRKTNWKLIPNDQREIAGFNCRKAQTILFDSVYVFVYYSDDIAVSAGPMNLNGLPGAILGVTVPRLHTSWIATGVKLEKPDPALLVAPTKGKKKTDEEIKSDLTNLGKSWGAESKKWISQMYWRTFI